MEILVITLSLGALMFVAYRGFSVILFAPILALLAVMCFAPIDTLPVYTNLFMQKASEFFRNYFPIFILGALFGLVIELSGFAKSLVRAVFNFLGPRHSIMAIIIVSAILTYGGVAVFVVVFAVYPFAAEMFRMGSIPKRLIPAVIWTGGITFTMDAMPGSPQIQNVIPTFFFGTDGYAAPVLGILGSLFVFGFSLLYLQRQRIKAAARNEGYDSGKPLINEPMPFDESQKLPHPLIAIIPLVVMCVVNYFMTTKGVSYLFGPEFVIDLPGMKDPIVIKVSTMRGLWAVETALVCAILVTFALAFKPCVKNFTEGFKHASSACLLAIMNTASEYGYGSIIAALPGFIILSGALQNVTSDPLLTEALTVNVMSGIVGSSSGGLSIALGAMSDLYIKAANAAGIPMEVVHRVAAMASGAMDSLPHCGAVITAMFVTGLTHRQAYGPIFAVTIIKTSAVLFVIAFYYITGIY